MRKKTKKSWVISQKWSHVLFINFSVDPEMVRKELPHNVTLDTFEGRGYVSIVPFYMSHIRFPYLPPLPFSSLWELNLRTYVRHNGRPGVYFFTLDTNHKLGQLIATKVFHLPYRIRQLSGNVHNDHYTFHSPNSIEIRAQISTPKEKDPLDDWLVERYSLFTVHKGRVYRGDVIHDPWQLHSVKNLELKDHFSQQFNMTLDRQQLSLGYSKELDVYFKPFKKVS